MLLLLALTQDKPGAALAFAPAPGELALGLGLRDRMGEQGKPQQQQQ